MKTGRVPPYDPFEEAEEFVDPRDVEINLPYMGPEIDTEEMELRLRYETLCPEPEQELRLDDDVDYVAERGYN